MKNFFLLCFIKKKKKDQHQLYTDYYGKLSIKETTIVKEIKLKEINVRLEQFNILMFSSLRRELNLFLPGVEWYTLNGKLGKE